MINIRLNIDGTRTQLGLTIEMIELVNETGDTVQDKWMVTVGLIFFDIEVIV